MTSELFSGYLTSKKTFEDALAAFGVTPAEAWAYSDNPDDQVPFSTEPPGMRIGDSPIHGKGVFATRKLEKGEIIAPARINGKRTPAGRYANHGPPNSEMVMRANGDVDLVALDVIEPDTEILSDYYWNYLNTRHTQG